MPYHTLNDPFTIYDWPHTRCSSDLSFFTQRIPVHSISTPFRLVTIPFTLPTYQRCIFLRLCNTSSNQRFSPTNVCLVCRYQWKSMAPKRKKSNAEKNPFLPPPVNLDWILLADKDYIISETKSKFDFVELQSWFRDTFIDQSGEIGLWQSNLPLYLFPQVYHFPKFSLKCQAHYLPDQRAIISSSGETLFLISPDAIDQMMQVPKAEPRSPLTIEILTELYQNLTLPQRAQIFELFLPQDAQFPKKNPPYHSSIFSKKGN